MTTLMTQPIPYQGSKRNLAKYILPYFRQGLQNLYEPFAGSAAITVAAVYYNKATNFFINDLNGPLMDLWDWMINCPEQLADGYELLWNLQQGRTKGFYGEIRDRFNQTHDPCDFLYLLARGVKGAIRYNSFGKYNQSPDNRRLGKNPKTMRQDIRLVSRLLRGRTTITAIDYREATTNATANDLIYLDPPYQGTCTGKDNRYYSGVVFEELVEYLENLNMRDIPWILSYDGQSGDKKYGKDLPADLHACHLKINAGRSSQATLNGGDAETIESVYLSHELVHDLNLTNQVIGRRIQREKQLPLLVSLNDH